MKRLLSAAIALSLLGGTAAMAQLDYPNYQSQNSDPRQNGGGRFSPEGFNEHHNDRPHWSRGDRVPEHYRQDRYTVSDWRQHNLRAPPRGYRWVRNDNDQYLLMAIRSWIIADIVTQNPYRNDHRWSRGERLWASTGTIAMSFKTGEPISSGGRDAVTTGFTLTISTCSSRRGMA